VDIVTDNDRCDLKAAFSSLPCDRSAARGMPPEKCRSLSIWNFFSGADKCRAPGHGDHERTGSAASPVPAILNRNIHTVFLFTADGDTDLIF
jgi:hypothetical protein